MTRILSILALIIFLINEGANTKECSSTYSSSNEYLHGFVFESIKVDTTWTCASRCLQNELCKSINMNLKNMICELNNSTKKKHPQNVARQPNMFYMEIRDDPIPGSRPDIPISSCKKLKEKERQAKSGVYWMKFNHPSSKPFKVFCDMTIDGGGWTLVYSYTFTKYDAFDTTANAVTPIPSWPVNRTSGAWVPRSRIIPLSESSHSAMHFSLWRKIGSEFLIKSNITNWVACVKGTGSLVEWKSGTVACKVIKAIISSCTNVTPNKIFIVSNCGPFLLGKDPYIHLEGRTDFCRPVHDLCGNTSTPSYLTNVSSPAGALYIR